MDQDDTEKRIAELERQQADLERQLADAKAAASVDEVREPAPSQQVGTSNAGTTVSPQAAQRFAILAREELHGQAKCERTGTDYWATDAAKEHVRELKRLKVDSGLSQEQFNGVWGQALFEARADQERSRKRAKLILAGIAGFFCRCQFRDCQSVRHLRVVPGEPALDERACVQ